MNSFPKLNLPQFEVNIKEDNGKLFIYDCIRKKYILLTPEEWVRQHFLNLLIQHYKYPKSLIKVESGLRYNQLLKRSDIIIYDRNGNPYILIECKTSELKLNQSGFNQVSVYNKTINAKYLVLTNGLKTFCCKIESENGTYEYVNDLPEIPS